MTKKVDLLRGAAYAKRTALERRSGLPETTFEEFSLLWEKRGFSEILSEKFRLISNMSYRLARINFAEGHRAKGLLQMAVAAGLDPGLAAIHLRRITSSLLSSQTEPRELTLPAGYLDRS